MGRAAAGQEIPVAAGGELESPGVVTRITLNPELA